MAGKEWLPKRIFKGTVRTVDAPIVEKATGVGLIAYAAWVSPIIPAALIVAGAFLLIRGMNRSSGRGF